MAQTAPYTLLVPYSIEGVVFGIICVLYAFCMYTLSEHKSVSFSLRLLCFANTVEFLLCTMQFVLHTILYFIVFTVHAGNIHSYLRCTNVYVLGSVVIFNICFIIAGFLSIWRLFVLYDDDIRVCVPALIVWIAQICTSGISIHNCATTPLAATTFSPVIMLLWVLITVLNLSLAIPICIRLCVVQKKTHSVLSSSPSKSTAIILVESGALITVTSVAMMILYACDYTYALVSIGIATEVVVASQLLVTARHALLTQSRFTSDSIGSVHKINVEPAPVGSSTQPVRTKSQESKSHEEEGQ